MLRIIETFGNLPSCYEVSPNARFNPGQIGSFRISRGKTILDVCDGINPVGVIDDIHSDMIRAVVWDEPVIATNCPVKYNKDKNGLVLSQDVTIELKHKNIIGNSIHIEALSDNFPIINSKMGELTFLEDTSCNYSPLDTNGLKVGVSTTIRYAYNIAHDLEKSSIISTNLATLWSKNMIAETDMFDTTQIYPIYANLYITNGLWTTARISPFCKAIAVVLYPPTNEKPVLKFLLDPKGNVDIMSQ